MSKILRTREGNSMLSRRLHEEVVHVSPFNCVSMALIATFDDDLNLLWGAGDSPRSNEEDRRLYG